MEYYSAIKKNIPFFIKWCYKSNTHTFEYFSHHKNSVFSELQNYTKFCYLLLFL